MAERPTYEDLERRIQELKTNCTQLENKLLESKSFTEEIMIYMTEGLVLTDTRGTVTFINQRLSEMLGYLSEEIIGKCWLDLVPPDQHAIAKEAEARRAKGHTGWYEIILRHKDGHKFLVLIGAGPRFDKLSGDFIGTMGVVTDISERKQAEKSLEEKSNFLQNIIDTTSDLVAVTDMEGNFKFIGPAHRFLGYDPDSLIGRNVMELVHPDDYQQTATAFAEFLANREDGRKVEYRYRRADGDYLWFETVGKFILDDAGNPKEILFSSRDVTERKQAEDALKKSEAKYRLITENMAEIITTMDMNLNFTYVSPSIIKLRGFTVEEALEQKIDQIMTPESFQRLSKIFAEEFSLEQTGTADLGRSRIIELEEYKKDGSTIWIENTASFIRDSHQKPIGIISISRDITDRKKAEKALESNYAMLQIAGETAKFGGWSVDLEKNICTWSDAVADIHDMPHGYSPAVQEAINFYAPEWRGKITQIFNACAKEGISYDEEMEIITQKGKRVWVRTTGKAVKDKIDKIIKVQGSFQDITERKQAEQKYQTLFREMLNGFALHEIICDATHTPVDYRFLDVNPAFERMTGMKVQEIVGKTILEILPRTELHWIELYGKVAHTGEAAFFENYHAELNMHFEVTAFRPAPNQFACIFSDITERKRMEETLEKSEERLKLALDSVSDAVWDWQVDTGEVYFSSRWYTMLGYEPYEFPQSFETWKKLLHPEDLPGSEAKVFRHLESAEPFAIEFRMRTKDNHWRWILARGKAVEQDEQGKAVRMLGTHMDISERKRAEVEREKLHAQLSQAQKMESVGRLAGGVAHDFNNMLGVILGHTELALLQADENHELHDDLKEIQKAAKRSADITKQLLAFARKQTISPRQLDLNDTVESMLNMLRRLIGEDIDLVWQPAAHLWPVKMDPSQVDQILANLCINAKDAIFGVGKLTIETGKKSFDEQYCKEHPGFIPGDFVLLAVSDNGCGMDKDTLDNLFEPFFTTKEVGKGTGWGLQQSLAL
jgi:PAS domain S-box-containing protein